jgi:carboxypeptidase family protein/TonB-dependent receptor-like protein
MRRKRLTLSLLLLAALLASPLGFSQVDYSTATLTGTVFDPQHLLIAGAIVTIKNPSTGFVKKMATGVNGEYRMPLLTPGSYQIEAEAEGFAKAAGTVTVSVGQIVSYDVNLKVGAANSTVEVSGELALVQVEQTQQANTLDQRQVSDLPNLSRSFTDSIYTLPGVSSSETARAQNPGFSGFQSSGFSIGGSNGRNNLMTIDGGENDYGSGQLRTPNVPLDSVQELQVNRSSFAAEFGFTSGTAVNIVTKTGTNDFHGSAYAFFSNESTDASNYFAPRTGSKAFEQNFVPGVTFGGPILKNKMFFFTSYEYTRTDTPQFRSYATSPEAQGILSNVAQQQYVAGLAKSGNPLLMGIGQQLNFVLTPSNFPVTGALLDPNTGTFNDWKRYHNWVTRIDYQPNSSDTITGRLSLMHHNLSRMYVLDPLNSPDDATLQYWKDYTLLGGWNHIFNSNLLNQLRVQVVPSDTADVPVVSPHTAYLTLGALGNFQGEHYEPYYARQRRFQFEDSLTWTKGHHTLKFGASYRPVNYLVRDELWFGGEFNFYDGAIPLLAPVAQKAPQAVAELVMFNLTHGPGGSCSVPADCYMNLALINGVPTPVPTSKLVATNMSAIQTFDLGIPVAYRQGYGNPVWEGWSHNLGSYVQDSWKVSRNFTLDFGGRMDWSAEASPIPHHASFSPRLGFAWSPGGSGKTVIRGGGGVFYAPVNFYNDYVMNLLGPSGKYIYQFATDINQTIPGTSIPATMALWNRAISQGVPVPQLTATDVQSLGFTVGPGQPGRVEVIPGKNFQGVHSVQASLSVQRELVSNMSLEVAYQMYHGLHEQIPFDSNVSQIPCNQYNPQAFTSAVDPFVGPCYTQINPAIVQLETYGSIGSSIYHGMTASLTRKWAQGLQFQANYTFSKTIDDNTDFNNNFMPFRPTYLNLERSLSTFNITHNFVASAVYSTPFKPGGNALSRVLADVTISPVVSVRSGLPFIVRVPGLENGTLGQSLYARPWQAGRNSGIGPGYNSLDLRFTKSFYIRRDQGTKLDLMVEGTNVLNHTNFSAVNDVFPANPEPFQIGSQTVDLMNGPYNLQGVKGLDPSQPLAFKSANQARHLQFGLKFVF